MATQSISVSELKWACLDETWRDSWLAGQKPTTFLSTASQTVHGHRFHKIAETFITRISSQESRSHYAKLVSAEMLWQAQYDEIAQPVLDEVIKKHSADSAYHLAQCLKAFNAQLASLRRQCRHFTTWQDVFVGHEYTLKSVPVNVGSDTLLISGQIDALRFRPAGGIEVVDYKLSDGAHTQKDLVQLAIYAKLIEHVKPAIPVEGVLEYYTPELQAMHVSATELQGIFHDVVAPALPSLFGRSSNTNVTSVSTKKPVAATNTSEDASHDRPVRAPVAQDYSNAIVRCFAHFNLSVQIIERIDAPQLTRYLLKPAPGVKAVSLGSRAEDLQIDLSLPFVPTIQPAQGHVILDILKESPETVYWEKVAPKTRSEYALKFPIGISVNGKIVTADLCDPNTAHALIAGASGSGKSEFLKSIVASLIHQHTPAALSLHLVDPKILTFSSFDNLPHLDRPVMTGIEEAIECLEMLVDKMQKRYMILGKERFSNLKQRMESGKKDLAYEVVVFDEFGDLVLTDKNLKKRFETLVTKIAQKGRAAGIHLLLATQRPDRTIVTGLIKANLPLKICMKVINAANSKIILDQVGGEKLLGKGDLLFDLGRGIHRAQSPFVRPEQLELLLKKHGNDA